MDYLAAARPAIRSLKGYSAGTTVTQAKARFGLDRIVKLSSNENPLGASPKALAALQTISDVNIYVDDDRTELRERLAAPYGLGVDNVILGNGSNDILMMFFATFVMPGDEIVMADPTFSLFAHNATLFDARAVFVPLRDGVHDLDAMAAAITSKTKAVVIVDPNNPTATQVDPDAFARFVERLPPNVFLLIDQAYREYMPAHSVEGVDYVHRRPGTLVARTMSKLFGLASLRFGFAFAEAEMIGLMQRVRLPFNVTRPAAMAAIAALDDRAFIERTLRENATEKAWILAELAARDLFVYPSAANFYAVRVPVAADRAYGDLLQRGIVVRSGDGLRLPNFLRITIGTRDENEALLAALDACLATWQATPIPA